MQKQWLWNDLQSNGEVMPLCTGLVDCTECGVRQHIRLLSSCKDPVWGQHWKGACCHDGTAAATWLVVMCITCSARGL